MMLEQYQTKSEDASRCELREAGLIHFTYSIVDAVVDPFGGCTIDSAISELVNSSLASELHSPRVSGISVTTMSLVAQLLGR